MELRHEKQFAQSQITEVSGLNKNGAYNNANLLKLKK